MLSAVRHHPIDTIHHLMVKPAAVKVIEGEFYLLASDFQQALCRWVRTAAAEAQPLAGVDNAIISVLTNGLCRAIHGFPHEMVHMMQAVQVIHGLQAASMLEKLHHIVNSSILPEQNYIFSQLKAEGSHAADWNTGDTDSESETESDDGKEAWQDVKQVWVKCPAGALPVSLNDRTVRLLRRLLMR